ncbi:glucans biosynthesis glucosyltransferase MdoH [uncultured Nisaea sp.]|uniref:glucans biosynthesis glucosyltransferase MdoH n=1 Tax=uncultured Nisaea sp. TaxID=538215 RepID=UPI0030EB826A|tara:strand:+ start:1357 stop:3198 length:1842 start_codon:yes stop_codon:yes gene_type:complete
MTDISMNQNRNEASPRRAGFRPGTIVTGIVFLTIVVATTTALTMLFEDLMPYRPNGPYGFFRPMLIGLFAVLTGWISCNFWLASFGAVSVAIRRRRRPSLPEQMVGNRLAILLPIYEEDPQAVEGHIASTLRSLVEQPRLHGCHLFILSDTRSDEVAREEKRMFETLYHEFADQFCISYRRRKNNIGRKAGNVQDFVEHWGGAYDYMLVLDADSRMDGATVARLADELDADPGLGLIQTWPRPVRAQTLFGRLQQFAASLYGQQVAAGFALIMGNAATYWGHNAMIRVRAFAECCGLPALPGNAPLGGEIMSHDFVEAAFLRRRDWAVRILPERLGSYEEPPPSLIAHATRDRRWCQGNLQHLQLLVADGIGLSGRLHFLMGSLAYLTSPIWLAFLLLSAGLFVAAQLGNQGIGPWGSIPLPADMAFYRDPAILFGAILCMLFGPKILGLLLALSDGELRRGHGGALRLTLSALFEMMLSVLTAPVMMLLHSQFVFEIFGGRASGWRTVDRAGSGEPFSNVIRVHALHFALGAAVACVMAIYTPTAIFAASPILAGLLLSLPVSYLGSKPSWGRVSRALGLFLIPEEVRLPDLLSDRSVSPPPDVAPTADATV